MLFFVVSDFLRYFIILDLTNFLFIYLFIYFLTNLYIILSFKHVHPFKKNFFPIGIII